MTTLLAFLWLRLPLPYITHVLLTLAPPKHNFEETVRDL